MKANTSQYGSIIPRVVTFIAMYAGVLLVKPKPDSKRPISSGVSGQLPFMRNASGLYFVLVTLFLYTWPPLNLCNSRCQLNPMKVFLKIAW